MSERVYAVVINEEKQYVAWPVSKALPGAWQPEGTRGTREQCLARIADLWTARPATQTTASGNAVG